MPALSPSEVLNLWEGGRSMHPVDRGVLALQTSSAGGGQDDVADWPLGRLNRAIAALRRDCFGANLHAHTKCPHCAEAVEFEIDAEAISNWREPALDAVFVSGSTFRLPTSRILAGVVHEPDAERAAALLAESCRIGETTGSGFSREDIDEIGEAMALADPLAEIAFDFECPACRSAFRQRLDLAEFFWREIEVAAKRLLFEVHTLASAYGWREAEVLALSAARRAFYIERVLG